jgi:acetaldehyde dehydrogenase (acetylating)
MKKVAVLGTGNIGTDLLIKLNNLGYKNIAFVGRRDNSDGIRIAKSLEIKTSTEGINYFLKNSDYDIVFDCTNAFDAVNHYKILKDLHIKVIDLTPAKLGEICVPCINGKNISNIGNVNMITCGGQASLPLIDAVVKSTENISYIEVVSQIASKSAGMSTRINIDNYIKTTEFAINKFTNVNNCKVILNVNPAEPCVFMQTTIFIKFNNVDKIYYEQMMSNIYSRLQEVKQYVPYYELVIPPMMNDNDILMISVKVEGSGDYLPSYAGNLDIINCAAIKTMEYL